MNGRTSYRTVVSNLARVMNLLNNSQPDTTAVTGYSVLRITSMADCKFESSSCTVSAADAFRLIISLCILSFHHYLFTYIYNVVIL